MSYCVNCGVELEASLKQCPLCNTQVVNPNEVKKEQVISPFPKEKEKIEAVMRKDVGILISIILGSTIITCGCLNYFVFNSNRWSLVVIGACVLLWVILFPVVIYEKLHIHLSILFDGVTLLGYLYLITLLTQNNKWFTGLAIPLVVFITLVVEIYVFCARKLPKSILTGALYAITAFGVLCVGIELLVDWYLYERIIFRWSAIAATVCIIIDAAIITLLSMRRFRNAIRRRFHF